MRKIMVGTVELERDVEMLNTSFQYAASFEKLKVSKGVYPIYAYESDIRNRNGKRSIGAAYIGYDGTVLASNVGGKPGEKTTYDPFGYGYSFAHDFLQGSDYTQQYGQRNFVLNAEWEINIHDFVSDYDNKRCFLLEIALKDGEKYTYCE